MSGSYITIIAMTINMDTDVIRAYLAVRMKRMHVYENIPASRNEMTKLI